MKKRKKVELPSLYRNVEKFVDENWEVLKRKETLQLYELARLLRCINERFEDEKRATR